MDKDRKLQMKNSFKDINRIIVIVLLFYAKGLAAQPYIEQTQKDVHAKALDTNVKIEYNIINKTKNQYVIVEKNVSCNCESILIEDDVLVPLSDKLVILTVKNTFLSPVSTGSGLIRLKNTSDPSDILDLRLEYKIELDSLITISPQVMVWESGNKVPQEFKVIIKGIDNANIQIVSSGKNFDVKNIRSKQSYGMIELLYVIAPIKTEPCVEEMNFVVKEKEDKKKYNILLVRK